MGSSHREHARHGRRAEVLVALVALCLLALALVWVLAHPDGPRGPHSPVLAAERRAAAGPSWLLDAPARSTDRVEAALPEPEPTPANGAPRRAQRATRSDRHRASVQAVPVDAQELAALLTALQDDDIQGNGQRAAGRLTFELDGVQVELGLEDSLYSHDYQERQFAASILRDRGGLPSQRLLEVSVEGLQDDSVHGRCRPFRENAGEGVGLLLRHYADARTLVERTLHSGDDQQRLLAAVVMALGGDGERIPFSLVPRFLERLEDNRLHYDASVASAALFHMGPAIRPQLEHARRMADPQGRRAIEHLLRRLDPPTGYTHITTSGLLRHGDPTQLNGRSVAEQVSWFEDRLDSQG